MVPETEWIFNAGLFNVVGVHDHFLGDNDGITGIRRREDRRGERERGERK